MGSFVRYLFEFKVFAWHTGGLGVVFAASLMIEENLIAVCTGIFFLQLNGEPGGPFWRWSVGSTSVR